MQIRINSLPAKNHPRFAADQFAFGMLSIMKEEWLTF
jgi:hypothetical protein